MGFSYDSSCVASILVDELISFSVVVVVVVKQSIDCFGILHCVFVDIGGVKRARIVNDICVAE